MSFPYWSINVSQQQHHPFPTTPQSSMPSFIAPSTGTSPSFWTTHWNNKWFIFKIPFWSICIIIPFLTCSLTRYLKPIVLKFDHVPALGVNVWLIARPIFSTFWLFFPIFSIMMWMRFKLSHPSIVGLFQCVCTHPIDIMGIHFYIAPMAMNARGPMM